MTKSRRKKLDGIPGPEVSIRDKVLLMLKAGHSVRAACGAAGVSTATYFRQRASDMNFALDCDAAKAGALAHVESKLLEAIDKGELVAAIFFLKSRAGSSWGTASEVNESPGLLPLAEVPEVADLLLR
ncbi:hypothetical protein BMS3Abin14_00492 [bacterium BMS3Abin14]|nr:hypothetical protein BMS3Abin14_00492 [bacterium BMS3Abin14]